MKTIILLICAVCPWLLFLRVDFDTAVIAQMITCSPVWGALLIHHLWKHWR